MKLPAEYVKSKEEWNRDPNFVKGFDGKPISKEKAIKINHKFYEKGVTALLIRNVWYRHDDENLFLDCYTGKMDLRSFLKKVIVTKDKSVGYVSQTAPIAICKQPDNTGAMEVMTPELAVEMGFEECLNSGVFYPKGARSPYYDHKIGPAFFDHTQKMIHKEGVLDCNTTHNTKYGMASHTFIKSEGKEYTFGVEMETSVGNLARHVYSDKLNMSCVRDGSVTGGEFVTGILKGDQGLLHLRKICKELVKRCDVDDRCGIHVHVGGFIPNKEFTIYAFVLGHLIQDELFGMLPSSRRSGEYSQPLDPSSSVYHKVLEILSKAESEPKIGYQAGMNGAYEEIFKWLSKGIEPGDACNKYTAHPQGRYCGGHSSPRYKWLNLICTNFSRARLDDHREEGKTPSWTIEFRNHSSTLSYKKIEAWILIVFAFVWFVEHRQRIILDVVTGKRPIRLGDIIIAAYPKSHPMLLRYISDRTHLFSGTGASRDNKVDIQVDEGSVKNFLTENFKPLKEEPKERAKPVLPPLHSRFEQAFLDDGNDLPF